MNSKLLPFALVLLFAPALFAQDYAIRLARPLKPGDELKLSVTAKMAQTTTQAVNDGAPQERKQEVSVQFDGTEKVIAVDANGKETKVTLTADKFTQTVGGGDPTDVVPKGTVIDCAVVDAKPDFQIDGKPAEHAVSQAASMVVDLSHGQHTDDEVFGAKEHKKKGDSWDMNTDLAKADLGNSAAGAEFSDLTGKTTLDDVTGDTMKVTAHMTGKLKPPLPPALTIDDTSFEVTFTGVFPVDINKCQLEQTQALSMTFSAHADAPSGGKVIIKSTVNQSVTRKTTPVK